LLRDKRQLQRRAEQRRYCRGAVYVKGRLKFSAANRKNLSARITTPSRGILLTRFSTDPNVNPDNKSWIKPPPIPARGIRVKVKPKGRTKGLSRDFFYMVLKDSRALGIVKRKPSGGYDVAYGPSLSQVFSDIRTDLLPAASAEYQFQFLDAMRFILARKFPKE